MNFKNQCVIVTGASGNLGRAVVHAFAARGACVALVDRDATTVDAALAALRKRGINRFARV